MTEFEKEIKPYEEWVEGQLNKIVPRPESLSVQKCAALIAQYEREHQKRNEDLFKDAARHIDIATRLIKDAFKVASDIMNYALEKDKKSLICTKCEKKKASLSSGGWCKQCWDKYYQD